MAQELPETRTPAASEPLASEGGASESAEPALSSPRGTAAARALPFLLLLLAAVSYRRLALWNPDAAKLPVAEWFFFGWSGVSPQLVFALAAAVAFLRRRFAAVALQDEGSPRLAAPLLAIALVLFVWGTHADASDVVLLSLIALLLGAAALLCGSRLLRRLTLPVLLLAFAIPPPGIVLNQLVVPLRLWTARSTAWLLDVAGVALIREGEVLQLASGGFFQVIDSCSGLRSIEVLSMLAVAWVGVLAVPRWHAILLVACAPVIAYLVNVVRVASLVLKPRSELSMMHSAQGVALFLAGIVGLAVLNAVLRRLWASDTVDFANSTPIEASDPGAADRRRRRAVLLALLLTALVGASFFTPRWIPPEPASLAPPALPEKLGGWTLEEELPLDGHFLGSVRFSSHEFRRYWKDGQSVSVFVGYDDRRNRDRSLRSRKNAHPGPGWEPEAEALIELAPVDAPVHALQARSGATRTLTCHWYEGQASLGEEMLRAALATDQSVFRRAGGTLVIRLSTPIATHSGGRALAEARLREVAALLDPPLAQPR